jgi:hypothetical protein
MTPEEWLNRGRELAHAVAPVVGIALKCEAGANPGMDGATARTCLEPSLVYFRGKQKDALAASIERMVDALERGTDVQACGAEVMRQLKVSYPA